MNERLHIEDLIREANYCFRIGCSIGEREWADRALSLYPLMMPQYRKFLLKEYKGFFTRHEPPMIPVEAAHGCYEEK